MRLEFMLHFRKLQLNFRRYGKRLAIFLIVTYMALSCWTQNGLSMESNSNFTNVQLLPNYWKTKDTTILYLITPTIRRSSQYPNLVQLSQTLMNVKNLHWIVVEDAAETNPSISIMLNTSGIRFTHLAQMKSDQEIKAKTRGATQRNTALKWIKDNVMTGVMYFADDDNTYHLKLFEELRSIKTVGIIPAGNLDKTGMSSPVVKNGKIIDFVDKWKGKRKFPVDMACIGINIAFYLEKGSPDFIPTKRGYLETKFLESLKITKDNLELKASGCTEILVWHTQTVELKAVFTKTLNVIKYKDTNIPILAEQIVFNSYNATEKEKSKKKKQTNKSYEPN